MDPQPILPSAIDLERRRLENTIDLDLHSLSLGSLHTTTGSSNSQASLPTRPTGTSQHRQTAAHDASFSSLSSLEYPRAFGEGDTGRGQSLVHPDNDLAGPSQHGPHGTPRAAGRKTSMMSLRSEMDSPVSTVGHHVSAVTLNAGVFRRGRGQQAYVGDESDRDEFDPERSLGRLVGELGKVMGGRLSPRPTSPFAALSPPRSPSPFSSLQNNAAQNLSLTLNRNDPLPSPPQSRSGSRSSSDSVRINTKSGPSASRFSSIARELGNDINTRKALGESHAHNLQSEQARRPNGNGKKQERVKDIRADAGAAGPGGPRPKNAPVRVEGDMTGMTALMGTPAKGGSHEGLDKNGHVGGEAGAGIGQHLATIQARLRAVETENAVSRRRVKDLEAELERARTEVEAARRQGGEQLREVIGEKTALEDLIKSLRSHLARLTAEVEQNKALIDELRHAQSQPAHRSPPRTTPSVAGELIALKKEVERLGNEVHRLGGIVEEGLDTRRRARGERTIRIEQQEGASRLLDDPQDEDEMRRIQKDMERRSRAQMQSVQREAPPPPTPGPSKLRQGLHAAAAESTKLMPRTVAPSTRVSSRPTRSQNPTPPTTDEEHEAAPPTPTNMSSRRRSAMHGADRTSRQEGPGSPFPSIRAEDEEDFFEAAKKAQAGRYNSAPTRMGGLGRASAQSGVQLEGTRKVSSASESSQRRRSATGAEDALPPQTVLTRVIRELEADFKHYKAIYAELADQYKVLDAASAVAKRKVLAEHLKEVIDTLEQKADQIAGLYDILSVNDRPDVGAAGPSKVHRSVPDIVRLVRESLGEEGLKRLQEDGVGVGQRW